MPPPVRCYVPSHSWRKSQPTMVCQKWSRSTIHFVMYMANPRMAKGLRVGRLVVGTGDLDILEALGQSRRRHLVQHVSDLCVLLEIATAVCICTL